MELKELQEFIEDRFKLQDRILEARFENTDLQFESVKEALQENSSHHRDLKERIEQLQQDVTNVKLMESAAKERHAIKELEKIQDRYSIVRIVEKYPKIVFGLIAIITGFVMSGNIQGVMKLIFPSVAP